MEQRIYFTTLLLICITEQYPTAKQQQKEYTTTTKATATTTTTMGKCALFAIIEFRTKQLTKSYSPAQTSFVKKCFVSKNDLRLSFKVDGEISFAYFNSSKKRIAEINILPFL